MKKLLYISLLMLLVTAPGKAEDTTWWGFWTTTGMAWQQSLTPTDGRHDFGVRLMPTNEILRDGRIHGVRFLVGDKTAVKKAWIWVTARPFAWNGDSGPDMAVKEIAPSQLSDVSHAATPAEAYTEVSFDAPVDILPSVNKRAYCYVGYTLELEGTAATPCHPVTSGGEALQNGYTCYYDWQACDATYGALALQLRVSGANIGGQAAAPTALGTLYTTTDADNTLLLQTAIVSQGTQPVSNIDYVVSFDGEPQPERHMTLGPIDQLEGRQEVAIESTMPATPGRYDCTVTVTKVNGQPNESPMPTAEGCVYMLSQTPQRQTVMEEYTGTWCPNCPRGDVGLHLLDSIYGNRFVGISVHNGDPMTLEAYDRSEAKRRFVDGYPSAAIDRTIACDPYQGLNMYVKAFQTDRLVDYALAVPTVADLSVTASWDETMTTIAADVATTFRYNAPTAPYTLALTVTADSLTGDGDSWLQVNTYVGSTEWDSYMDVFTKGERRMRMSYDHVPVYVDGIDNGIDGSITLPLVADATQHYRRTIALDDIPLKDILTPLSREHLHVVALLLDPSTGLVVNAAKGHVATDVGASVGTVPTAAPLPHRLFTPDGRPAAPTHRGLVIEQRNDGRRKVVIK